MCRAGYKEIIIQEKGIRCNTALERGHSLYLDYKGKAWVAEIVCTSLGMDLSGLNAGDQEIRIRIRRKQ